MDKCVCRIARMWRFFRRIAVSRNTTTKTANNFDPESGDREATWFLSGNDTPRNLQIEFRHH